MLDRKRLRIRTFLTVALLVYVIGCVISAVFLAEITLHVGRRPLRQRAEFASVVKHQFQSELQDAAITAYDGAVLRAWYAVPRNANGATVILLHGVTDNREGVAGFSQMFMAHGYSVLLPDARAHGESGGDIATYGIKERYDIRDWAKWAKRSSSGCVYLFGESMGAAVALQGAAVTPDVCAVAVESPFSHFREIAYDRIERQSGLGRWFPKSLARPVLELSLLYARIRYRVDLTKADPASAMAATHVPELLIHGTEDHNIPLRHSLLLMEVGASHAELWQVRGAVHGNAVEVAPKEFERRILDWFRNHAQS
jgi:dipeptidyl aminopeptidase/acylaminoacyl peptidase